MAALERDLIHERDCLQALREVVVAVLEQAALDMTEQQASQADLTRAVPS